MLLLWRLARVRNFVPWPFTINSTLIWFLSAIAFPIALAGSPATFRFAWLSDTHVGSSTGEEDLRATVQDLNSITGLSFVVLSGDVTEFGSRELTMWFPVIMIRNGPNPARLISRAFGKQIVSFSSTVVSGSLPCIKAQ
jgi:hypothetical protein